MVKEIIKDESFLKRKSFEFIPGEDDYIIDDLLETAKAHKDECVGLAAVQIGYLKNAFVVLINGKFVPFINPVIIQRCGQTYTAAEGCLSVEGLHEVQRRYSVRVAYTDRKGKRQIAVYSSTVAQIIQHEHDHLNGILI